MARNRQQLKSLGTPVAASWSYRSWWEASGDRQHQAGEELNLPISRDRCSKYSGPWVPGASSQYPNHQWAIMSLPSWRQPSISLGFPAWPAHTHAAGSPKLSPTLGGRVAEARWCWNPTPFPSQPLSFAIPASPALGTSICSLMVRIIWQTLSQAVKNKSSSC